MATEKMKLVVWNGDWGLPSVDPHCLAVLTYCKFSGVPVDVVKTANPWHFPKGKLPALVDRDETCNQVNEIFSHLRKEHWGSDFELSEKQSADVVAFSAMLEEKLLPALLQLWWVDDKTFVDVTRPWFAKTIPFPFSLIMPWRVQKAAGLRVMLTKGSGFITNMETEAKVYKEAKECLNILSYKLGKNEYMFGHLPCSLDALIFGYLAPLLKAPLPSNPIHTHLLQCDNLVRMVNDILSTFFPFETREFEEKKREEQKARSNASSSDLTEYPHRKRNMILAGLFAITAMVGYAFSSGLIELSITDEAPKRTRIPRRGYQPLSQSLGDDVDGE